MAYESGAGKSEEWRRKQWDIFWKETVPKMKSGEIVIPLNSNPNRMKVKAPPDDKSKIASLANPEPMTIAHHTKLKPWQQNRKNQYDMMLQNDMMHPKDYEKHMKRHKIDPEHWLNFS